VTVIAMASDGRRPSTVVRKSMVVVVCAKFLAKF